MKKINSKSAFTLIELIVSCLLVSVIVLGIVSINTVMSNNSQDYGQRYLINSDTQTTLDHILNSVSMASGSGNPNDEAILIGSPPYNQLNDANTFCIHQLGKGDVPPGQNTVSNASDVWLCYQLNPVNNQIQWCAETYSAGNDPRGASSCSSAGANLVAGPTYLGTAFSISDPKAPTFSNGTFNITITNCLNDTDLVNCQASGVSANQAVNPEVQISGSMQPKQVSS